MKTSQNREEKSLRHVAMVVKFLDDNEQKRHLKSEFTLFQNSSILFNFFSFLKCWQNFLGLNPKGSYLICVRIEFVFIYSIKGRVKLEV